jgi:hypothetical protein
VRSATAITPGTSGAASTTRGGTSGKRAKGHRSGGLGVGLGFTSPVRAPRSLILRCREQKLSPQLALQSLSMSPKYTRSSIFPCYP